MSDTDKGKLLMLLLGKGKPKDEAPEPDAEDDNAGSMGLSAAMSDFLAAIKHADPDAMAAAFADAIDIHCQDGPKHEDKEYKADDSDDDPLAE